MHLVSRLHATEATEITQPDVVKQFPRRSRNYRTEEYHIKLREDAKPYSLFVPRNVPIPLRPKVKQELYHMEQMGVISKGNTPNDWCAGMVVKTDEVRICVDLKPLNESVLWEPHPMPKVDDTLALLRSGATIFSKLDAINSGFWKIPLAPASKPLTTFIAPFGRYQFNKTSVWYFLSPRVIPAEDE